MGGSKNNVTRITVEASRNALNSNRIQVPLTELDRTKNPTIHPFHPQICLSEGWNRNILPYTVHLDNGIELVPQNTEGEL